jgi:hypothetical protein
MLQRHIYATGKKYYVAKAPAFSAKIETLAEFFPEARIIYLARNPLDMLPSTISWINYARRVFTQPKEKYLYLDEIVDFTQHWYRHPLKYLDSHPSPRHLILKYDDLILRPEQTLRAFYEQFGYPDKPGLADIVDQAVKETLSFHSDMCTLMKKWASHVNRSSICIPTFSNVSASTSATRHYQGWNLRQRNTPHLNNKHN